MAGRAWLKAFACAMPLFLAGCVALPGSSHDTGTADPSVALATQVAAAVAATMAAHSAGTANTAPPSPTVAGSLIGKPDAQATPARGTASPVATRTSTAVPTDTLVPTPILLAPVSLAEHEAGGGKLAPRYWTNTSAVVLTVGAPTGGSAGVVPQVELEPIASAYNGLPSGQGMPLLPGQTTAITVPVSQLPEGAYHWRARLALDKARGPWADYYNGPAFRLDRTPPSTVVISSTTYPDQSQTYSAVMAHFSWTQATDNGALQGTISTVDRDPNGVPTGTPSAARSVSLGPLANGTLYFHVRAEDWAGNLGPIATYAVHIDATAPKIAHTFFDRYQFNPQYDKLTMHFTPSKDVAVHVEIRRQTTSGTVRILDLGDAQSGKQFQVAWDGRNYRGVMVPVGLYTMLVKVTDKFGNVADGVYTQLGVNYRRIVVHLASQSMDVYDGSTLLKHTLVTTGNALLPTPPGIWHIGAKFHPYKFISTWPKSSPYYYAPSNVQYAMYFHSGGYFIHDAPWRTVYGPGTNTAPGPPGVYSGTHGCVNVPSDVAAWLYKWAAIGTVVDVRQ
jgi:hypothetical protein